MQQKPMKKAKFTAELFITALCLYMIHTLAVRLEPVRYDINMIPAAQIDTHGLSIVAASQEDVYEFVAKTEDPGTLNAIAKEEAQRMIQTGDTSRFEAELDKNGLLLSVTVD